MDLTRLMVYSSETPDIDDFSGMIRCQKARYEFETDGVGVRKSSFALVITFGMKSIILINSQTPVVRKRPVYRL